MFNSAVSGMVIVKDEPKKPHMKVEYSNYNYDPTRSDMSSSSSSNNKQYNNNNNLATIMSNVLRDKK